MRLADHELNNDHGRVEAWRMYQLLKAGLPYHRAQLLANRTEIDLHRIIAMLEKGCDQKTLLRILL